MYSEAYDSYDSTNRILSIFTDNRMRAKAVKETIMQKPRRVLDIATGTGNSALLISRMSKENSIDTK